MITISEVSNDADLQSLQGDWNALLEKIPDENPFLSFEWVSNYRKSLSQGKLFVLTAQQNGNICCIAPLCITQRNFLGLNIRVASFITTQQTNTDRVNFINNLFGIDKRLGWSDQAGFLYDPDDPEALYETIRYLKQSDQWDILDLREMSSESLVPGILGQEFGNKHYWLENLESTFSKKVLMPHGFEDFKNSLKRKIKKNINLYANRLEKLGGVVTRHFQEEGQISRLFPKLAELEHKGRKGAEQSGILVQTKNREFHEAFAGEWGQRGRSHIFTLERDQEILSYTFLFQGKNEVYVYSTAFNPEYRDCSPGFNIVIESMKILAAQGFQTFNLGRGDGLIIRSLSNDRQLRTWTQIIKKTFLNRFLYFVEFRLRPKMKILFSKIKGR